jgi:hypothetical protein
LGTFIAFLDTEVVTSIKDRFMVGFIMFNATFNYTSVITWWAVYMVEETGENHQPVASH